MSINNNQIPTAPLPSVSSHEFTNFEFIPSFIPSRHQPVANIIRRVEATCKPTSTNSQKVLILLRGLPGSGKSTIARALKEVLGASVCSADDYFCQKNGVYNYDRLQIEQAHVSCQKSALEFMKSGKKIIAIDNTNCTCLEMEPYVRQALKFGYEVIPIESETAWKFNASECAKRNQHNVPLGKITQMKKSYEKQEQVVRWISVSNRQLNVKESSIQSSHSQSTPGFINNNHSSSGSSSGGDVGIEQGKESSMQSREFLIHQLLQQFPHLNLNKIEELYEITGQDVGGTIELLKEIPIENGDAIEMIEDSVAVVATVAAATDVDNNDNHNEDNDDDHVNNTIVQDEETNEFCLTPTMQIVNIDFTDCQAEQYFETNPAPPQPPIEFCDDFVESTREYPPFSSIALTKSFLMDAQNQFSLELGIQQIDFEKWPNELIENWSPPPHVAKAIFMSFLQFVGIEAAKTTSKANYFENPSSSSSAMISSLTNSSPSSSKVNHPDRHRWHSESELKDHHVNVNETSMVLTASDQEFHHSIGQRRYFCLDDDENLLPFREIMDIDMALERSVDDQRHLLSQVSSRMKLRLLKEMFPAIEMCHLEEIYVRYDFSTTRVLDHLLSSGHVPKPTLQFDSKKSWPANHLADVDDSENDGENEEDDEDLLKRAFFLHTNQRGDVSAEELKERLEEERGRKIYLQNKIQQALDKKSSSGVAYFYQCELSKSNRLIKALEKRISQDTVSVRRVQDGIHKLDIHHLNIRNGLDQVKKRINEIQSTTGIRQSLTIITGRGLHSAGPARLRPAVKKFLDSKSFAYEEKCDGHFVVQLK